MSTTAHPESDGQPERMNLSIEVILRHFVNFQLDNWVDFLPMIEFAMNSTPSASTGKPPFQVVYGDNPPDLLSRISNKPIDVPAIEELRDSWINIRDSNFRSAKLPSKIC
jgi:hypothetical protein